jgi:hypothetical protein
MSNFKDVRTMVSCVAIWTVFSDRYRYRLHNQ